MDKVEQPIARRQHTAPKRVWLTHETRAAVQEWADVQGVSFSSALDTLARIGLGQAPGQAVAPMVVSAVRTEMQRQTHRLAALLAATALESGVTARLAGATLRTLRPDQYEAIKRAARLDAVQALRRREGLAEVIDGGDREGELPHE
jgi:hypothetical protein